MSEGRPAAPSGGERERRRWAGNWQSASGSHRKRGREGGREREREREADMHSFTTRNNYCCHRATAADGHGPICSGNSGTRERGRKEGREGGSLLRSDSRCPIQPQPAAQKRKAARIKLAAYRKGDRVQLRLASDCVRNRGCNTYGVTDE